MSAAILGLLTGYVAQNKAAKAGAQVAQLQNEKTELLFRLSESNKIESLDFLLTPARLAQFPLGDLVQVGQVGFHSHHRQRPLDGEPGRAQREGTRSLRIDDEDFQPTLLGKFVNGGSGEGPCRRVIITGKYAA